MLFHSTIFKATISGIQKSVWALIYGVRMLLKLLLVSIIYVVTILTCLTSIPRDGIMSQGGQLIINKLFSTDITVRYFVSVNQSFTLLGN